jgi:opacity protein-like surface antigen
MLYGRAIKLRRMTMLVSVVACLAAGPAYAACTDPAGVEGDLMYNSDYHTYQFCNGALWLGMGQASGGGGGGCSSPAGVERDIIYNTDYHTYQFCNGTNWVKM